MTSPSAEMLAQSEYVAKVIPIRIKKDTRGVSRELPDDPFTTAYREQGIIEPPYDMFTLAVMPEVSSELGPAVEAMVVNIAKMGYRIVPREGLPYEENDLSSALKDERAKAKNFFANAVLEPTQTFTTFRATSRHDLETTGNSYFEILENVLTGEPAGLNHLPSWQMRLRKEDDEMTDCEMLRTVEGVNGEWAIQTFPYRKRFRRFAQIRDDSNDKVFFKEWGDPRKIDKRDGHVFTDEELNDPEFTEDNLATSVIHLKLYCPRSPYGLPRWIGNLFTIFGNRAAEVINYTTFRNNNIPALIMMGTNVQLTQASIERIQKFVEERIQGDDNYSTILLVEAEPMSEGLKDPGNMKLELKELVQSQHTDAMFVKYMERGDDKLRRTFRLPPIFMGRAEDYTRACYSDDTETLTERGWKCHWEIGDEEKIAAFNPDTGEMRFVVPEKKYVYQVENEWMYHIHGKTTDCLITPDHKVIVRQLNSTQWRSSEIRMMPFERFDVLMAASEWHGEEIETFLLPKSDDCKIERGHTHPTEYGGDDWLEFLGYFISEGGFVNGDHPGAPYYVRLSQKKSGVKAKMIECINRLGLVYSEQTGSDGTTQFWISNRCLCEWLRRNVGTYSYNKRIPWEYLNLSKRQLQILMNALMMGDGTVDSRDGRKNQSYSTSSSELAGQVQRLLIQIGYRAVVGPGTRALRVSFVPKQTAELRSTQLGRLPSNVTQERYTGSVYCYSVPEYGYFVTRRNGRVAIQGNTADASRKVAEEQVFRPERNEDDIVWNQTILPALHVANFLFRSNTPDVTDNYELTQLLAVAEQSGGLSPIISRMIVEDVLGKDLPPVDPSIPGNIPFTLTMQREQVESQLDEGDVSTSDATTQLEKLKVMMDDNESIPEEARKSVSNLLKLLKSPKPTKPKVLKSSNRSKDDVKTLKLDVGQICSVEKKDKSEERIVGGAVLVPGVVDLQGDIYEPDVVVTAAQYWLEHYMEDPKENGIKFMHKGETIYDAARPVQSWCLDRDMEFEVYVPAADADHPAKELETISYPKGTWMLYARIRDDELWGQFKSGEISGWSIGGVALVQHLKRLVDRFKKSLPM